MEDVFHAGSAAWDREGAWPSWPHANGDEGLLKRRGEGAGGGLQCGVGAKSLLDDDVPRMAQVVSPSGLGGEACFAPTKLNNNLHHDALHAKHHDALAGLFLFSDLPNADEKPGTPPAYSGGLGLCHAPLDSPAKILHSDLGEDAWLMQPAKTVKPVVSLEPFMDKAASYGTAHDGRSTPITVPLHTHARTHLDTHTRDPLLDHDDIDGATHTHMCALETHTDVLVDAGPNPVAVAGLDGRVLGNTTAFSLCTGYSSEELERLTLFNLLQPQDLQDAFHRVARMVGPGASSEHTAPFKYTITTQHPPQPAQTTYQSYSLPNALCSPEELLSRIKGAPALRRQVAKSWTEAVTLPDDPILHVSLVRDGAGNPKFLKLKVDYHHELELSPPSWGTESLGFPRHM